MNQPRLTERSTPPRLPGFVRGNAGCGESGRADRIKAVLGAYGYSQRERRAGPMGVYVAAQVVLLRSTRGTLQSYVQLDWAEGERGPIEFYFGAGTVWRDSIGELGVAVAAAEFGSFAAANLRAEGYETALELTYARALTEHLKLQPAVQRILNPGGRGRDAATVGFFRLHWIW